MTKILLYGRRNVCLYALSYLKGLGYEVKVLSNDENVIWLSGSLKCELVSGFDKMGDFDVFISVHGQRIVPMKYLEGKIAFNVHPCLEKGYKGKNPIKTYIELGDKWADVSSHHMTEVPDEGEIIETVHFYTGKVLDYANFYNIAAFYYFLLIHQTLEKLNIKP